MDAQYRRVRRMLAAVLVVLLPLTVMAGAGAAASKVYLPLVMQPLLPTPPGEWSSQNRAAIASIVNNAGKVEPLAETEHTVTTSEERDDQYKYTVDKHHVVDNIDSIYYLGLNDDIIWPGSLIRGDTAHDFLYTPISTRRAPVTLSVSLESVSCAGELTKQVNDPKLSTIRTGIRDLLQAARNDCTTIPAKVHFSYQRVYNESHLNLFVKANVKYGAGDLDTKFTWDSQTKKTKMMAKYQQIYYSVDIDTPTSPAAFFNPSATTVGELAAAMPTGSRPLYVASVSYGMMALMFIESNYSEQTMNATLNASYSGVLDVEVETGVTAQKAMEDSTISIVVYGGSTLGLGELETGLPGFLKVIHASMNAGPDSPGVPLVYKFRHLADNTLALVTLMSDYSIKGPPIPLLPKVRVTLDKFKCTMSDDEGAGNLVDMDRFQLKATAFNKASTGEPGTPAQSPNPQYVCNWATSGEYDMDVGDEWPPANQQGSYYLDIQYNNLYPYGPGNWDFAYLKLEASARDYDTTSADEWGSGFIELKTGGDTVGATGTKQHIWEIRCSDFAFDVYVTVTLLP